MPRWCWPSRPRPIRARWRRRSSSICSANPTSTLPILPDPASSTCVFRPTPGAASCWRSPSWATTMAVPRWVTGRRSMSNMSPPIRPVRCTWATAAARWWAMRCAACSNGRATGSCANITSTTPAGRSTCSRARRICVTARRWARISAPFPKGCIRGTTSSRWASGSRRNSATPTRTPTKANGSSCSVTVRSPR